MSPLFAHPFPLVKENIAGGVSQGTWNGIQDMSEEIIKSLSVNAIQNSELKNMSSFPSKVRSLLAMAV